MWWSGMKQCLCFLTGCCTWKSLGDKSHSYSLDGVLLFNLFINKWIGRFVSCLWFCVTLWSLDDVGFVCRLIPWAIGIDSVLDMWNKLCCITQLEKRRHTTISYNQSNSLDHRSVCRTDFFKAPQDHFASILVLITVFHMWHIIIWQHIR